MGATIATNKKAFRDYQLTQNWECGIALKGSEVKSVRAGKVSFKDTFARIEEGEVLIYNLYIENYKEASYLNEETDRPRKLLLHKQEIKKIIGYVAQQKGILVPTKVYFNNRGLVKVSLALGKGKRQYDKRDTIKKRDVELGLKRALRARQKR